MADQYFRSGIVFAAAAGVEERRFWREWDPAAETKISEGDDRGGIGLPIGGCGNKGGGRDIDKDV